MLLFLEGTYLKPEAIAHRKAIIHGSREATCRPAFNALRFSAKQKCFEVYIRGSPAFTAVLDT
jgi:hypothetical protein